LFGSSGTVMGLSMSDAYYCCLVSYNIDAGFVEEG
jgi:hypothetical protein